MERGRNAKDDRRQNADRQSDPQNAVVNGKFRPERDFLRNGWNQPLQRFIDQKSDADSGQRPEARKSETLSEKLTDDPKAARPDRHSNSDFPAPVQCPSGEK